MTKGKIALIGTVVIILFVTFLFINNYLTKGTASEISPSMNPDMQTESEKNLKEVEEISTLLYQKDGFFEQVNTKLKGKGYAFQMMVVINSKDDIEVKYILENKDATESIKEEIKSTFYESVENNNLDTSSFNLKIGDRKDGPDW
ncbi:hypothetical protein CSV79_15985 [Sporosarcina sp. P13]|uniref:hypothetical protein n=1 Tax=Sporosarcina sp. P13 TaxID=2048263 RepID=UPI000C170236|nr:hypothetical protein [Sporosarcina sp. P13]PIC62653.1 hypothetical protein CSV79_15985 [Sporosarcina sp. P13]